MLDPTRLGPEAARLRDSLAIRVVGQPEAIQAVADSYQVYLAGLRRPNRPICSLLFLGPTGTGKTYLVECVAEILLGNPKALLILDCGEYHADHETARLTGAPPGYLGHRETVPVLCQERFTKYHTDTVKLGILLIDEIEKASPTFWNILLSVLDRAEITLGDARKTDFSQVMVFMTGNLGARDIQNLLHPSFGFGQPAPSNAGIDAITTQAARKQFPPEFFNRMDRIVAFNPLGEEQLARVLELEVDRVVKRLPAIQVCLSSAFRERLLATGRDPRYGARPMQRTIERALTQPLANLIGSGQLKAGDSVNVDYNGAAVFTPRQEARSGSSKGCTHK